MLKESLSTLRSIHLFIVGVVAATLVFSLSPNPRETAYRQLQVLDTLTDAWHLYRDFRDELHATYISENPDSSICIKMVGDYLGERNISFAANALGRQFFISSRQEIPDLLYRSDQTLDEFVKMIQQPLVIYKPAKGADSSIIATSPFSEFEHGVSLNIAHGIKITRIYFLKSDASWEEQKGSISACHYRVKGQDDATTSFVIPIELEQHRIPETISKWLANTPQLHQIASNDGNGIALFPTLQANWYELGPLTVKQAKQRLKDSVTRQQDALQVLGFSIEPSSALLVSPILMLLSLLYFSSHATHCLRGGVIDTGTLHSFPWIGVYKDGMSRIITFLSITVLPLFALVVLIMSTSTHQQYVVPIAITLTALTALASAYATYLVHRLNQV